jgi:hypothetical protein
MSTSDEARREIALAIKWLEDAREAIAEGYFDEARECMMRGHLAWHDAYKIVTALK